MTQEQVIKALDATIKELGFIDISSFEYKIEAPAIFHEGLEGCDFHATAQTLYNNLAKAENGLL